MHNHKVHNQYFKRNIYICKKFNNFRQIDQRLILKMYLFIPSIFVNIKFILKHLFNFNLYSNKTEVKLDV